MTVLFISRKYTYNKIWKMSFILQHVQFFKEKLYKAKHLNMFFSQKQCEISFNPAESQ